MTTKHHDRPDLTDLLKAARDGALACQLLANQCNDEDDTEAAEEWQARADFIEALLRRQPQPGDAEFVTVPLAALRSILDYLRENEEQHYDETLEDYPEDAPNHVYRYVLDIERGLDASNNGGQP